jgi:N-acetylglucosamine repressor
VGHMTVIPEGPPCKCGNRGCWETLVSQGAVFRRVRRALSTGVDSRLREDTHGDLDALSIPLIVEAARAGDSVALDALEETGLYLGIGLANLVNALNPEIVVFGGILSLAAEFILPVVQRVISERALRWSVQSMRLLVSAHGADACVMGGIATVYHQILSQPFKNPIYKAMHASESARV